MKSIANENSKNIRKILKSNFLIIGISREERTIVPTIINTFHYSAFNAKRKLDILIYRFKTS